MDTSIVNSHSWDKVPFTTGDWVLLKFDNEYNKGVAVWNVPSGWEVNTANDDVPFDFAHDEYSDGLLINGSEHVWPDRFTIIREEESPISLDGYSEVIFDSLKVGDEVIIISDDSSEYVAVKTTLTDYSIEGHEEGELYSVLGISFSEEYDNAKFYRKNKY